MPGCILIIALKNVADLFGNRYSINIPATPLLAKQTEALCKPVTSEISLNVTHMLFSNDVKKQTR